MNKKGEEEGIGTTTQILLIVIGLVVIAAMMYTNVWPKVKGSFTNIVGEKGDVNKIYEDVFKQDEIKQREEETAANEIISTLIKNFDSVKGKEGCIKVLDFSSLKNKDFEIEFIKIGTGSKIKVVKENRGNQLRIYNGVYNIPICLVNKLGFLEGNENYEFWMTDEMSKVYDGKEEIDLILESVTSKPIIYKSGNQICFVGRDSLYTLNDYPDIESCDETSRREGIIETVDALCGKYGDSFSDISGMVINNITGFLGKENECEFILGYSDEYRRKYKLSDYEINKELNEILYLVKDKFKPLKVKGVNIYLVTEDELAKSNILGIGPYFDFISNTIFIDFHKNPESILYHEYVHAYQRQLEQSFSEQVSTFTKIRQRKIRDALRKYSSTGALEDVPKRSGDIIYLREYLRYDFIPEYSGFFETLDFCTDKRIEEGDFITPENGIYIMDSCVHIRELIAHTLERIKYFPEMVYISLHGEFGHQELYQKNLDLALKYGWITKEDYDLIVNYNLSGQ